MTEPTTAEIRKIHEGERPFYDYVANKKNTPWDEQVSCEAYQESSANAKAKLHSVDELLGELIGEGKNDFADRLGRAMKGQRL